MSDDMIVDNCYIGRRSAWHRKGLVNGDYITRQQIDEHGITFDADVRQLQWNGNTIPAWGVFHTATDTFIAPCGENYAVHPASVVFDTADELIAAVNGAKYETAGIIGTYQKVWGLIDIKESIRVGDDLIQPYLVCCTSYDGSCSTTFDLTSVRIVCHNTFKLAMSTKSKNALKIRHTSNSHRRLNDAREALQLVHNDCLSLQERMNFLASRYVNPVDMKNLLEQVIAQPTGTTKDVVRENRRRENILDDILRIFEDNDGNAYPEQRGTAYNLLNAVTNYVDHKRSTRTSDGESEEDKRAVSALFGTGDKMKTKAYEVIMQSAGSFSPTPFKTQYFTVPDMPETPILDSILAEA